jgi:putative sterol carrier protein
MAPLHRLDDAVDWFRKSFRSEAAEGLCARYELRLAGPRGGSIRVSVADGTASIEPGEAPDADVRMRVSLDDWFAVLEGRENVDLLYMAGRLEIEGDLSLAVKLRTLFRPA